MERKKSERDYEFGGPIGNCMIIALSHCLVYYLWICLTYYNGGLAYPSSLPDFLPFLGRMGHHIREGAAPTYSAAAIYLGFIGIQFALAWIIPGIRIKGLPIPSENNRQLTYLCNGTGCWYATLALVGILQYTGLFPISRLADQMGSLITIGVISANFLAIWLYLLGTFSPSRGSSSGNPIYDFFMGVILNPRIGKIDLKLFSEIRIPWILLFLLTLSAAAKQYELNGMISSSMAFMIVAHGLYTNACMKGEECIPSTWDIFYEKFGWMLIFWNYVGVPFVYCFQSFYILKNNPQHSTLYMVSLFAILLAAYYVWDTANSQKNRFRMQLRGTFFPRKTFPQLPWGTLKNPEALVTASGDSLLVDGWYRYGKKLHYTADAVMAITWGLSCGFGGVLPYLYPLFFISMIAHRYHRDRIRCAKKYGKDWERYCEKVPYTFIPYIY